MTRRARGVSAGPAAAASRARRGRAKPGTSLAEAAAALAGLLPLARLDPAVVAFAATPAARGRWGVAFSGGADSLALLLLVWAHWPARRRALRALHFNHRLRGAAARADAMFCRRMCAQLGVRFIAGSWRNPSADASEAAARDARLGFLRRQARILWFGHQQDDVAESMLMRLARGSGSGGLAAPRPVQPWRQGVVHLRPLLGLKKSEIATALRSVGLAWRDDESNATDRYQRNRVRAKVVPAWLAAAGRDAVAGSARSRQLLEEDDRALEAWLTEVNPVEEGELKLERLRGRPRALWRRALHRWLGEHPQAGELSRAAFDALLLAAEKGANTRQSLGHAGFAVIRKGALRFEWKEVRRLHRRAN